MILKSIYKTKGTRGNTRFFGPARDQEDRGDYLFTQSERNSVCGTDTSCRVVNDTLYYPSLLVQTRTEPPKLLRDGTRERQQIPGEEDHVHVVLLSEHVEQRVHARDRLVPLPVHLPHPVERVRVRPIHRDGHGLGPRQREHVVRAYV